MILTTITFVSTEDGGRKGPIASGYRPQFFFEGRDFECRSLEIIPDRSIQPGETACARIVLSEYASAALSGKIKPGRTFELHEGSKSVAGGVITNVEKESEVVLSK